MWNSLHVFNKVYEDSAGLGAVLLLSVFISNAAKRVATVKPHIITFGNFGKLIS